MKIDSHQHFWKYNPEEYAWIGNEMKVLKRDYMPEDLEPQLLRTGFNGTVAVQARQSLEETRWLLGLAAKYEFIKGVVGWVDLCSANLEDQLSELSSDIKLTGVRHVLQDEPDAFYMLRDDFLKGIRLLHQFNLTYDVLIFERQLPQTLELVRMFPDQVFVLNHIAKPEIKSQRITPWNENMFKLAQLKNVYCKLSGMVTEADWVNWKAEDFRPYVETVLEAFGTDRLMIGSDWPVCLLAGNYDDILKIPAMFFSELSIHERDAILGLNAIKAYHL